MTLRSTMSDLIITLRGLTNTGTDDYTIAGRTYWSNEQLQTALDRRRFEVRQATMQGYSQLVGGGTVRWTEYQAPWKWLEKTDGGTARFWIQDATGATISVSNYSVDYTSGLVTFTGDQGGSIRMVSGYAYDVYGAAADVWSEKAAQYATAIDFSTDNHNVKRSHIVKSCEKMAKRFDLMAGATYISDTPGSVTIYRGDTANAD